MKTCFWLSSYPRSGNTWLRLIISGLYFTKDGLIEDFDILNRTNKLDSLKNFEFIKDISLKDYELIFSKKNYNEKSLVTYSKYWIEAQKRIKLYEGNFGIFKTHNARVKINNHYYTDETTTLGFIYISRDPRDIVISYSNYLNQNYDEVIDFLINGQLRGSEKKDGGMPEIILSWKDHYLSWKKFNQVPSIFLKYENLKNNIEKEILKIIDYFEENFNIIIENKDLKIKNVIKSTNLKYMQEKEKRLGFIENSENKSGGNFFRKGAVNEWKETLSNTQINSIEKNFEKELKELNYL